MPPWVRLCCPSCRGKLLASEEAYTCEACERQYPIIFGIPDFRLTADPYISIEDDRAKGLRIVRECKERDLESLLRFYWSITEDIEPARITQFIETVMAARARGADILDWLAEKELGADESAAPCALEIGCGAGGLLAAASGRIDKIVGVDRGFRWLVVARLWLDSESIGVPLVCANADALPFAQGSFNLALADGVIEHNEHGQEEILAEAARVIGPGGRLFVSTPNRLAPIPDPHYGVLGLGLMPKSWRGAAVRRLRGKEYLHISLLGPAGLRRMMRVSGIESVGLHPARFGRETLARFSGSRLFALRLYGFLIRVPLIRGVITWLGPVLWCVGRKPASESNAERP